MARFFLILFFIEIMALISIQAESDSASIETRVMRNYNRKHRPVKKASTVTNVNVVMVVNHIEEIDENEQTMLVHGLMWASWVDEYIQWDPSQFNDTRVIQIQSWRLWQPALALYNNAKSNTWNLHLNGAPNGMFRINSEGTVYASGVFSFYVTCGFDFSDFPNDVQKCPIVLADWVYDLSKVNLTGGKYKKLSSIVRLSANPFGGEEKHHIGGWEVIGSYEKVCYYGPNGCEYEFPEKPFTYPIDIYWSLIEFGIKIKRHAPYFLSTIQLPLVISAALSLFAFWIESPSISIGVCLSSMMLQCFIGYALLKMLPPSTARAPNIIYCYSYTFIIGLIILTFHVCLDFARHILPEDIELPFQLTAWTEWLRNKWPFKGQNFTFSSFDPENLLETDSTKSHQEELIDLQGPHQTQQQNLFNPNFVNTDEVLTKGNAIIEMDSLSQNSVTSLKSDENSVTIDLNAEPSTSAATSIIQLDNVLEEQKVPEKAKKESSHLEQELHTLRQIAFFITLIAQFLILFLLI